MNSRERVLAAINHQPVDRVPTDIWATGEVMDRLKAHFGSLDAAMDFLHIDGIHGVSARYAGPSLGAFPPGTDESSAVFYGIWGMRLRRQEYVSDMDQEAWDVAQETRDVAQDALDSAPEQSRGVYLEQANFPLADCKTLDDLEAFPWPSADWFDYSGMRQEAEKLHRNKAVSCGYMAPFYLHNLLRGLETSLMDPHDDAAFTHMLISKICDFEYEYHLRMFEATEGLVDIAQVTDDLGSQAGPMISLKTYREFYKPQHKRFIDLCHQFGIKVFHHDDGSMRAFLPDLIEIGIDILNPVQWTCPGMDMVALKRDFGDALAFHGAVDNQQVLPFGTPEDVRTEVRHCIDALASDGTGYILAPCHNLQVVSPLDNIIAMYDEAYHYGRF